MEEIIVKREVLHQLARKGEGRQESGLSSDMILKIYETSRKLAEATAIRGSAVVLRIVE